MKKAGQRTTYGATVAKVLRVPASPKSELMLGDVLPLFELLIAIEIYELSGGSCFAPAFRPHLCCETPRPGRSNLSGSKLGKTVQELSIKTEAPAVGPGL